MNALVPTAKLRCDRCGYFLAAQDGGDAVVPRLRLRRHRASKAQVIVKPAQRSPKQTARSHANGEINREGTPLPAT